MISQTLLNFFGSEKIMRFDKRKQRVEKTIDKILDNLEMFRRPSQPGESNSLLKLAVALSFNDSVKSDELRTMLATDSINVLVKTHNQA